jgi:hypothetical protein
MTNTTGADTQMNKYITRSRRNARNGCISCGKESRTRKLMHNGIAWLFIVGFSQLVVRLKRVKA